MFGQDERDLRGREYKDQVGGIARRTSCGARILDSYAQGINRVEVTSGGLVGMLADAHVKNSYSSVLLSNPRTDAGGSVGKIVDGLLRYLDGKPVSYICSGNMTKPPPSTVIATFYDSLLSSSPGAAGIPKSQAELKQKQTFNVWGGSQRYWDFVEGHFMPAISSLPRAKSLYH